MVRCGPRTSPSPHRRPRWKVLALGTSEADGSESDEDGARTALIGGRTNTVEVATPECEPLTLPGEIGQNVTNDPNLDESAYITQHA